MLESIDAAHLREVVVGYRDALRAHQEKLNRLNVYPVSDGDTGTNMALTLESVVSALDGADDMGTTCKAISHGSLMGARGNSGVILSQVLRGMTDTIKESAAVDGTAIAEALRHASEAAYSAVMRPVEGTILTVVRESATAAGAAAANGDGLDRVLEAAATAAGESLARTPELLPVLKEAGVVDAGAAGYVLLLDVLLHVVDGRPVPEPELVAAARPTLSTAAVAAGHVEPEGATVTNLRYEVMYFLEAPDESIPAFKNVWAGIGDSIVVVGGDGIWNCHIHTDDIGAAVEAAIETGRPRNIRVTDLMEQVEEERWVREAPPDEPAPPSEPVPTAGGIGAVGPDVGGAATGLLEHLVPASREIVTVIEGEGATAADTRRITEWLAEHRPDVSTEVHHGGQPLYPYLVSVE